MNLEIAEPEKFLTALFSAVVNGLLQALFPAILVWLFLRYERRTNAATRHAILFGTLLLTAALPLAQIGRLPGLPDLWEAGRMPVPFRSARNVESSETRVVGAPEQEPLVIVEDEPSLSASIGNQEEETARWDSSGAPNAVETAGELELPMDESVQQVPLRGSKPVWFQSYTLGIPAHLATCVAAGWALLAVLRLCGLLRQCRALRRLKANGIPALPEVQGKFDVVREEFRMSSAPRLVLSDAVPAPMAAGFLHPAVLLPHNLEGAEHLEAIFRHELAHIARRDHWANLIQQVLCSVLFFHPVVWWLSRRLTVEREIACDDHVLAGRLSRRAYALFLADFAGRDRGGHWVAAPAAWSSSSQLKERIVMILDTKRNASPRLARTRAGILAAAASMAALCAVAAGPRLVLAESSASASNSSTASSDGKVVTTEKSVVIANGIADEKSQDLVISAGPAKSRSVAVVETRNGNVVTRITASDDDDDSGPKVKSRAPSAGVEGDGPRAPRAPQGLPALPAKPGKPALAGSSHGDGDLEKRLDRLEKMVQSLVKEKAENRDFLFNRNFHYEMKEPMVMPHPKVEIDQWKQMGKLGEEADRMKKEFAKREADRRKDMDKAFAKMREKGLEGEIALKAQRDALEATRSSLERELRNIERQMQQIERQQEKMERDRDEQERNRERSNRNEDSERSKKKEKAENRDSSKDSDDSGEKP